MSSPLVGAWELVSDARQGVSVFTETHYSLVAMSKNRQRREGGEPTPDEAMEAYQDVAALAGAYTVSGSKVTLHRVANLRADVIGQDIEAEFTIEGDRLTLRNMSGASRRPAPLNQLVWRKVG